MGASRKLQGEIDRVLKKVQEGVDVFDSIWTKVYDTDNANQKEKFEADLKKEIKKLQRYRDQIKTWIQSSEIKDKKVSASYEQALVDARKLIEREMERFKICEKETKTKAFSKEGLGQQPKTDPKEKAKSETRDWLNNVVGELESQIDSFEAEMEGLSVKKGKTRPPRLTHLETSITRHKAHIMKLELILRLLDNDELSPEQVNDVKDFLDDYVERNQDDFDEFDDVDELYNTLPLDKVESLEDLVSIVPPLAKVAPVLSLKTPLSTSASQMPATPTSNHQPGTSVHDQFDDTASQDSNSDSIARTPPAKNSVVGSPAASTLTGSHATPVPVNVPSNSLPAISAASANLPGSTSVHGGLENASTVVTSSTGSLTGSVKEDEITSLSGYRPSPTLADAGLIRGIGRGGFSSQPTSSIPLSSGSVVPSNGALGTLPLTLDTAKRNLMVADERLGSSAMVQPLASPISNRMTLPQAIKANDGTGSVDSANIGEAAALGGRPFSPTVPGMQWRPVSSFQSFQNQNEPLNSQSSAVSSQSSLGLGIQGLGLNNVSSVTSQQPTSIHQQSNQQALMSSGLQDADTGHLKLEESQQQQNLPDNSNPESAPSSGFGKNPVNEDDLKDPYTVDAPTGLSGSVADLPQVPRDIDLSPGQPLQSNQPSGGLGVIGRRSVADLGAIGDSLSASYASPGVVHDQMYNLKMLEAAYYKLPLPKDSERLRSYTPRHPAATPASYPQIQAPIVNNPAFWERLSIDSYGTDTLFYAFYYQQNTYQQYLAARELKKQSWRYHRKYNTWFQRHEEPKIATDEYEQGTYVYFDFHIANDESQHGWCQRIKTEFTFEYNYLEDELMVS
ncbi:general negative regulator of transcription subunit 3-like isoform X4 [Tripterygium wilfordii]|uniref:general negative regulator of transcription subunit 3-like isoform X4 n=1 Tax=Tripterygium wilfordii TaxID=458696 RepID=UPI0018F80ABC|nr:general negative regulator of transcription subunit 3-like isoform X4 [Tripterygium wilfordii]